MKTFNNATYGLSLQSKPIEPEHMSIYFFTNKSAVLSCRSRGFTLVELLISIVLGMVLVGALVTALTSNKQLASTETSMSRIQESGRFVMNLLAEQIRRIGYHGCSDPKEMNITVMAKSGVDSDFGATSLRGFEVSTAGTFTPALATGDSLLAIQATGTVVARPGSDVIQMRYADRTGAKLTGNTDPVNANIKVDGNPTGLSQDDIAMVADCQSAHIFSITNVTSGGGGGSSITMAHASSNNDPNKMLPGYGPDADLLSYTDVTYFVGDTGRNTNGGTDVYALYSKEVTSTDATELVEGVEFMQILYGEELDTGNIRFVPAGTAGLDMQSVVAIRIGVLIQDFGTAVPDVDSRTYTLLDATISGSGAASHSGGRFLRKPFSATVQLRNTRS